MLCLQVLAKQIHLLECGARLRVSAVDHVLECGTRLRVSAVEIRLEKR